MYYSGVRKLEKTKQFCRFSVPAVVVKALTKCCVCMCFRCWLQVHQSDRVMLKGTVLPWRPLQQVFPCISPHCSGSKMTKNQAGRWRAGYVNRVLSSIFDIFFQDGRHLKDYKDLEQFCCRAIYNIRIIEQSFHHSKGWILQDRSHNASRIVNEKYSKCKVLR